MAALEFNDGVTRILRNNFPVATGGRFANWVPLTRPYGDSAPRLSDAAITFFEERTDYGASFDLVGIPVKYTGPAGDVAPGTNLVAVADRLIAHLIRGGQAIIHLEDALATNYTSCGLLPGSTPSLRLTNRQTLEYTLSLQLLSLTTPPVRLDCVYA